MREKFAVLEYIYLDREGVERLYAQTVSRLVTEYKTANEKSKDGKTGGKVGLGKLLGFVGLDIGANAEFTLAGKSMEEATSQLTVEQKLSNLIRYMEAHKGYEFFGNLVSAAARLESSGGSVFVEIREKFSLPQFYSGQDGVAAVNSSKTLMFELGEPTSPNAPFTDDYSTYSDDYYKGRSNIRVIMNASLGKLVRTSGEMGQHSHDAILFRGFQGRKVPLTVFGHLTSVAHLFCQIKPYAIWL